MSTDTLTIAIVDDEPLARLRLQQVCEDLSPVCPNRVCANFEHGTAMVNAIPRWTAADTPDVLLLDINMPGLNGLEIAAYLGKYAPHIAIIFISAEPQHALHAFDLAALDYVLKPVREQRLLAALLKAKAFKTKSLATLSLLAPSESVAKLLGSGMIASTIVSTDRAKGTNTNTNTNIDTGLDDENLEKYVSLLTNPPSNARSKATTLSVHLLQRHDAPGQNTNQTQVINLTLPSVLYFKAEQKTTLVRTATHTYTCTQSLTDLESWLHATGEPFVRVHRNALLRASAAGQISLGEDNTIQVCNENGQVIDRLAVSRRMLPRLNLGQH